MAKVGKGAIENLTQGMYTDSRIVYREYIQNACDQIDEVLKSDMYTQAEKDIAEIIINIDTGKRNIYIRDNATGISARNVERRLGDVADSDKEQGQNKGFRGIGRLGGLGYCKELRFVTSFKGEAIETTMIWNAQRIQDIILDKNNHSSAEEIIAEVVSYSSREVEADKHYFEVQMLGINSENDKLLDYRDIKQYISEVAPVDFKQKFIYRTQIQEFINEHDEVPSLDCYKIGIRENNGELVYISKECPMGIYKMKGKERVKVDTIKGIHADVIFDVTGKAVAWIWYAISSFKGAINDVGNPWKGLRLRQFNIQIGDNIALARFFKEDRGNSYFIGEVHTISPTLRPNARRDYFNETQEVKDLENALREYFKELHRVYKAGSDINSSYNNIKAAGEEKLKYQELQEKGFSSPEQKRGVEADLERAVKKAQEGIKTIKKYKKKSDDGAENAISQVFKNIEKEQKTDITTIDLSITDIPGKKELPRKKENAKSNSTASNTEHNVITGLTNTEKKDKTKWRVDELSFLDRKTRKIVVKIYEVIDKNLMFKEADDLISKIQKELKESQ